MSGCRVVPCTSTHPVWGKRLPAEENTEPIEQRRVKIMRYPIQKILSKNGHPEDPTKWTYGAFHDLNLLKKWWDTPKGVNPRTGEITYHDTDPLTNLPFDFDQYDNVEVMDGRLRVNVEQHYADVARLALMEGRRGGVSGVKRFMQNKLPTIKRFRGFMKFYANNPPGVRNPMADWMADYWHAHPSDYFDTTPDQEGIELNPSMRSHREATDEEYHAFRMRMVSKIRDTYGTPEFYYVKLYWLYHPLDEKWDTDTTVAAFNAATAEIKRNEGSIDEKIFTVASLGERRCYVDDDDDLDWSSTSDSNPLTDWSLEEESDGSRGSSRRHSPQHSASSGSGVHNRSRRSSVQHSRRSSGNSGNDASEEEDDEDEVLNSLVRLRLNSAARRRG